MMIDLQINNLLLVTAILWPLLLALPVIHSKLRVSRQLAIIPAAILLLLPGDASLSLPTILFGSELHLDTDSRWILAMSVVVWFIAATLSSSKTASTSSHETSFFMMTLAGNMGVIFANDLVTFFSFSTLMSYSFYALLVDKHNDPAHRAGYWYLIFLILADLALFEAMLLAASISSDLRYDTLSQEMAGPYSAFYMWMVVLGFAFKSGFWPFFFWLSSAYSSRSRITPVLLTAVPVAMGLLGLLRWLPVGEQAVYSLGIVLLCSGSAAILHMTFGLFKHRLNAMLMARITVIVIGLSGTALGAVLIQPALWQSYGSFSHPIIALLGITPGVLSITMHRFFAKQTHANEKPAQLMAIYKSCKNSLVVIKQPIENLFQNMQTLRDQLSTFALQRYQQLLNAEKMHTLLSGWKIKITLFVILGLSLSWLAR